MILINNPFITSGYVSAEYFCDREAETEQLTAEVTNGNNLALISTRRMGKTGLIQHCFQSDAIRSDYHTFFIDIYATRSLREFTYQLSKSIVNSLKSKGKKAISRFGQIVKSLQVGISFDMYGMPAFRMELGDIRNPEITLDEIFRYLDSADKPCIVAIDEFQQITIYPEKNIEALLRSYIQQCKNARFIFAGSQRHIMGNMFLSAARPFYQSVAMMHLDSIPIAEYTSFAKRHFGAAGKQITDETIATVYNEFEGITWYVQRMLHTLYNITPAGETAVPELIRPAVESIISSYSYNYSETMFRLPEKQKELLIAITREGDARAITSGAFIKKYRLNSSSSVQAAIKGLLEKDFVTHEQGVYKIYDRFLGLWIKENY